MFKISSLLAKRPFCMNGSFIQNTIRCMSSNLSYSNKNTSGLNLLGITVRDALKNSSINKPNDVCYKFCMTNKSFSFAEVTSYFLLSSWLEALFSYFISNLKGKTSRGWIGTEPDEYGFYERWSFSDHASEFARNNFLNSSCSLDRRCSRWITVKLIL